MQTQTINIEETVSRLIETCRDDQQGFETAADAIADASLKLEFLRYSRQCGQFATDLEQELRKLGQTPPTHGTFSGALRRGWLRLAAVITRGDEHAILLACRRAQEAAMDAYALALASSLPADVHELVGAQHRVVSHVLKRIESLCDHAREI